MHLLYTGYYTIFFFILQCFWRNFNRSVRTASPCRIFFFLSDKSQNTAQFLPVLCILRRKDFLFLKKFFQIPDIERPLRNGISSALFFIRFPERRAHLRVRTAVYLHEPILRRFPSAAQLRKPDVLRFMTLAAKRFDPDKFLNPPCFVILPSLVRFQPSARAADLAFPSRTRQHRLPHRVPRRRTQNVPQIAPPTSVGNQFKIQFVFRFPGFVLHPPFPPAPFFCSPFFYYRRFAAILSTEGAIAHVIKFMICVIKIDLQFFLTRV